MRERERERERETETETERESMLNEGFTVYNCQQRGV